MTPRYGFVATVAVFVTTFGTVNQGNSPGGRDMRVGRPGAGILLQSASGSASESSTGSASESAPRHGPSMPIARASARAAVRLPACSSSVGFACVRGGKSRAEWVKRVKSVKESKAEQSGSSNHSDERGGAEEGEGRERGERVRVRKRRE